jgi:hypothetical protein
MSPLLSPLAETQSPSPTVPYPCNGVLDVHVHGVVERIMCAREGAHAYSLSKLILRASRREICNAERLCTDGSRKQLLRSDGDGLLCLLYVYRMGSITPCTMHVHIEDAASCSLTATCA